MATHLFLASTPFNMLTSAMVAFDLPAGDHAYLGLIDQPESERAFVSALKKWQGSPFEQTLLLSQQAKGKGKRQKRQLAFKAIAAFIEQVQPDNIYTGNDRRIEFQFAMHYSNQAQYSNDHEVIGIYLDDGTYSYLGRKTHWLKDQIIDNLVKKLSYGFWWQQPTTIGASKWIKQAILAFPDSAIAKIQQKNCQSLPQNLEKAEFKQLASLCLENSSLVPEILSNIDALLLLPHESVAEDQTKQKLSYWLAGHNDKIAFKHHPRTNLNNIKGDKDAWLIPERAIQVPAGIPMEVLLPLFHPNCQIAGDVSTALLTAKWLRPELEVKAFSTEFTPVEWLDLLKLLQIQIETV